MSKKATEIEKKWYRLGYLNGTRQLEGTLKRLKTGYGHLFDEITRLDKEKPRVGVLVDYKTFDTIILIAEKQKRTYFVRRLKQMQKRSHEKDNHAALMNIALDGKITK